MQGIYAAIHKHDLIFHSAMLSISKQFVRFQGHIKHILEACYYFLYSHLKFSRVKRTDWYLKVASVRK